MTQKSNVLVLVATGFEDIELIGTIDILTREQINYQLVSIENHWEVKGKYNSFVKTTPLNQVDIKKFDSLFLPGGPGYKLLIENTQVLDIVKTFNEKRYLIGAICAAPEVLVSAHIVDNRHLTAHPGYAQIKNNFGQEIEVCENLITGRDFRATFKFADALVKYLSK